MIIRVFSRGAGGVTSLAGGGHHRPVLWFAARAVEQREYVSSNRRVRPGVQTWGFRPLFRLRGQTGGQTLSGSTRVGRFRFKNRYQESPRVDTLPDLQGLAPTGFV